MKKIEALIFVLMILCIGITGCAGTSKAYTFGIENGDSIKVKLDTSSGYDIVQSDGQFTIVNSNGEIIVNAVFITPEYYEAYANLALENDYITGEKDGNAYILYQYVSDTHTENNYIVDIDGTDVGLIMASMAEKQEVQDIFALTKITVE